MRKTMLVVVSGGMGVLLMALFGACIAWQCIPVQAQSVYLEYPCLVEGTELIALQLASYEGPFLENRDRQEVVNTAALLVKNCGGFLASGAVVLEIGDARLVFELYDVPAGSQVLVLEKDCQQFVPGGLTGCYGWEMEAYPEDMGHVVAQSAGGMLLSVTNRTDGVIPVATISYRSQNPNSGIYLGGVSYHLEVRDLQPGEERIVMPPYYSERGSLILYVTTWVEE